MIKYFYTEVIGFFSLGANITYCPFILFFAPFYSYLFLHYCLFPFSSAFEIFETFDFRHSKNINGV